MVTDGILGSQLLGPPGSSMGSSLGSASPQSVERFQEAYGRANEQIDGASNAKAADPMALLDPLLSLDSGSLQLAGQAGQVASSADLKPGELMMLTMQSHQFLFQCELTSNVANRSSDGLQQLFRQQS